MSATGSHSIVTIVTLAVAASTGPARADEPSTEITPQEGWTTLLSGDRIELNFAIRSAERLQGRVVWSHSADRRPLARGEQAVTVAAGASAPCWAYWRR